MSIEAMPHLPYTDHRDYVALSTDLAELPHDCGDGSTCIMSDTEEEYVFHKSEDIWKKEKRPIPSFIWISEYPSLNSICNPLYGTLTSIRDETGRRLYWFNGASWKNLEI